MNHIIVSDSHLGVKKGSSVYTSSNTSLYRSICDYAKNHKITSLIHAGDFFDTRKSISVNIIDIAQGIMTDLEKVFDVIYLIVGNHDSYYKSQVNPTSLSIFKEYKKVNIIDEIITIGNITMVPWLFDIDQFLQIKSDVCIGHFDINDIPMNSSGYTSLKYRLNVSDFKNFKKVFSGHYHVQSQTNNIQYLGSPMQFTFNEINETTGFYVFDDQTLKLEFIEFNEYPKHVIITDDYKAKKDEIYNNNVKLVFNKDHGISRNTEIIRDISMFDPSDLKIMYYNVNTDMTDDMIDDDIMVKSKLDMLYDFYKKSDLPEGIRYGILEKIVKSIYDEVKGE